MSVSMVMERKLEGGDYRPVVVPMTVILALCLGEDPRMITLCVTILT